MFALTVIYNNHSYDLRSEVLDHSVYFAAGYTITQVTDILRNVASAHHTAQRLDPERAATRERDTLAQNLQILREVHADLLRAAAVDEIIDMM